MLPARIIDSSCADKSEALQSNWVLVSYSSVHDNRFLPANMLTDVAVPPVCETDMSTYYMADDNIINATVIWDISCNIMRLEKVFMRNCANRGSMDRYTFYNLY